jgi:hypothetical protein
MTCIFILVLLFIPLPVVGQGTYTESSFVPASLYDSIELVSNPELEEPMDCGTYGSSGEFSYQHDIESGILTLNWTHTAGTELDFEQISILPECREFAFFSNIITWSVPVPPTFSNISLQYNITTTGDFHNDIWPGMYEIAIWLVSPDNIWLRMNTFYGGSDDAFLDWIVLDQEDTEALFQLLMASGSDSSIQLVIGLIPSWRFLNNDGEHPWQTYNGSVAVSFHSVSMNTLFRTNNDFPEENEPLYDIAWNQGDSDFYRDSCLTPDGHSLLLSSYEIDNMLAGSSLTYLNSRAEVEWRMTWNDTEFIQWHDVACDSERIYLLGSEEHQSLTSMPFVILDWEGNYLLQAALGPTSGYQPKDLAVSRDGEIYVGYSLRGDNNRNYLMKINDQGEIIWDRTFDETAWNEIISVDVSNGGSIFTLTAFEISKWNQAGVRLWSHEGYFDDACVLSDGSVIVAHDSFTGSLNLTKFDSNGIMEWSYILSIEYSEGWYDYLGVNSITQAYDESIYLLLATGGYHPGRFIMQIDSYGNRLGNTTIVLSEEIYLTFNQPQYFDIHISENNLVYLYGRILDRDWDYSITMAIHGIDPLIINATIQATITTAIAASLVLVTLVIYQRWKGIPSSAT